MTHDELDTRLPVARQCATIALGRRWITQTAGKIARLLASLAVEGDGGQNRLLEGGRPARRLPQNAPRLARPRRRPTAVGGRLIGMPAVLFARLPSVMTDNSSVDNVIETPSDERLVTAATRPSFTMTGGSESVAPTVSDWVAKPGSE